MAPFLESGAKPDCHFSNLVSFRFTLMGEITREAWEKCTRYQLDNAESMLKKKCRPLMPIKVATECRLYTYLSIVTRLLVYRERFGVVHSARVKK